MNRGGRGFTRPSGAGTIRVLVRCLATRVVGHGAARSLNLCTIQTGSGTAAAFNIAQSGPNIGSLSLIAPPIPTTPTPGATANPQHLALVPSASLAYVANFNTSPGFANGSIAAFSINSGALTSTGLLFNPPGQFSPTVVVAVDPGLVYVAAAFSVAGYTIANPATGELSQIAAPIDAGLHRIFGATVDPDAAHLFTVDCVINLSTLQCDEGSVSSFEIGSGGALSSPVTTPTMNPIFPRAIAVDPNSNFAYVIGGPSPQGPGWIESFAIGGATPEPIAQLPAGTLPESVVVDPTDRFVYVTDDVGNVLAYEITPATGELTGPTTVASGIPGADLRTIVLVTVQLP